MASRARNSIREKLKFLYGPQQAAIWYPRLLEILDHFAVQRSASSPRPYTFSERDVILITYGDMVAQPGIAPLETLRDFLSTHLKQIINTVHILPFFPYSSDDGFSVISYRDVNPGLGTWAQIRRMAQSFRLMFDAVINHISAESDWFHRFLAGDPRYQDYFITADPTTDLSIVVRPRVLPLLTPVQTATGVVHVWTTFSADQVDLNYANPEVLLELVDLLLYYIRQGGSLIRLDAIAFLWKEAGTACIHLPQTHAVVQLLRAVLDDVAPEVLLITETNVPYTENVSYFGDGTNEAHMVYQFALPPLIAHTLLTGSARALTSWASRLSTPSSTVTFFNFTASHDGIGVRPVTGILTDGEIQALVEATLSRGGRVSYKTNSDGSQSPYELNITYFSLLNDAASPEPRDLQVRRFLLSQAMTLALAGVPGIYFHSLIGSRNFAEGVQQTGHARTINRERLTLSMLMARLDAGDSIERLVFKGYWDLLRARISEYAFDPHAMQEILHLGDAIFAVLRRTDSGETLVALHNVRSTEQVLTLDLRVIGMDHASSTEEILTGTRYEPSGDGELILHLAPYQMMWLKIR